MTFIIFIIAVAVLWYISLIVKGLINDAVYHKNRKS